MKSFQLQNQSFKTLSHNIFREFDILCVRWLTNKKCTEHTFIPRAAAKKQKFGIKRLSPKRGCHIASGDPVNAFVFGVKFLNVKGFSSFSKKVISVVNFLNNNHFHVTTGVPRQVEMHSSGLFQFTVSYIASVLVESLLLFCS